MKLCNSYIFCQHEDENGLSIIEEMPIKENSTPCDEEHLISNNSGLNALAANDHTYVCTSNPGPTKFQDKIPLSQLLSEKDITAIKKVPV